MTADKVQSLQHPTGDLVYGDLFTHLEVEPVQPVPSISGQSWAGWVLLERMTPLDEHIRVWLEVGWAASKEESALRLQQLTSGWIDATRRVVLPVGKHPEKGGVQ